MKKKKEGIMIQYMLILSKIVFLLSRTNYHQPLL